MNKTQWLRNLKIGDPVTRLLAGSIRQDLQVTALQGNHIICGQWIFHGETGFEIDEALGWDGEKISGSYIEPPATNSTKQSTSRSKKDILKDLETLQEMDGIKVRTFEFSLPRASAFGVGFLIAIAYAMLLVVINAWVATTIWGWYAPVVGFAPLPFTFWVGIILIARTILWRVSAAKLQSSPLTMLSKLAGDFVRPLMVIIAAALLKAILL